MFVSGVIGLMPALLGLLVAPPALHGNGIAPTVTRTGQVAAPKLPLAAQTTSMPTSTASPFPVSDVLANANTPFERNEDISFGALVSTFAPFLLAFVVFGGFYQLFKLFSSQF